MLSFNEYRKINRLSHSRRRAREMWNMYIEGEKEIMNLNQDFAKTTVGVSFSCTPMPAFPVAQFDVGCQKQEVENTMTANTEREYLTRRLRQIQTNKRSELALQFKLYENTSPKTFRELLDWVKNDKYEIDTKRAKFIDGCVEDNQDYNFCGCFDGLIWTGRGKVDREGYLVAEKALGKAYQDALDIVQTSEAAAGLTAMQEFDAWTYKAKKH